MAQYECMLLVEPTAAAKEWTKVAEEIEQTYQKHGAKLLNLNKWGERKLAYPIQKLQRGTYVLTYFEGAVDTPNKIKADFVLSERIMRAMILQHEGEIRDVPAPAEDAAQRARMRPSGGGYGGYGGSGGSGGYGGSGGGYGGGSGRS